MISAAFSVAAGKIAEAHCESREDAPGDGLTRYSSQEHSLFSNWPCVKHESDLKLNVGQMSQLARRWRLTLGMTLNDQKSASRSRSHPSRGRSLIVWRIVLYFFLHIQSAGAAILLLFTVSALVLSKSPRSDSFEHVREIQIGLQLGSLEFARSLREWLLWPASRC